MIKVLAFYACVFDHALTCTFHDKIFKNFSAIGDEQILEMGFCKNKRLKTKVVNTQIIFSSKSIVKGLNKAFSQL